MKTRILMGICLALLVMGSSLGSQGQTTVPAKSKIPASLKSQAKISIEEARATASKKVPGAIKEEELEKEKGKLVYSFDIQATGEKDITEVQVSAIDGSIVSVEKEDAAHEAKEQKQEAAKKAKPSTPPQQ
jgi:uncharacterized membrane protein YkoI